MQTIETYRDIEIKFDDLLYYIDLKTNGPDEDLVTYNYDNINLAKINIDMWLDGKEIFEALNNQGINVRLFYDGKIELHSKYVHFEHKNGRKANYYGFYVLNEGKVIWGNLYPAEDIPLMVEAIKNLANLNNPITPEEEPQS